MPTAKKFDYYLFPSGSDWGVSRLVIAMKIRTLRLLFSGCHSFIMFPVLCCLLGLKKTQTIL